MTLRQGQFFIGGRWVAPLDSGRTIAVVDPSTEAAIGSIACGTSQDVERAVQAARIAFDANLDRSRKDREEWLVAILDACEKRRSLFVELIIREVGVPLAYARDVQIEGAIEQIRLNIETLRRYEFEAIRGGTTIRREPIGVVGMITPWNWPLVQIICKVVPALAAGCSMILKPSELSPLSALAFAEAIEEAGVPDGLFNLVNGDGPSVGEAISRHPGVDMVSFTGSTRAGVLVAKSAADTVKRVTQELGGKSANILLPDCDFDRAVRLGAAACFDNNGQTCDAPTRMFVPASEMARAASIAAEVADDYRPGHPWVDGTRLGPLISGSQRDKVLSLIQSGIDEGARLVTGGLTRPNDLDIGYYVKATVFSDVLPDMRIAREEIFGPVLSILAYDSEEEAIRLANDTEFGLAAYVQSADPSRARRVAERLRAGTVYVNYPDYDLTAPFGGYKQSGNGREYGSFGLDEYLEIKSIVGT